MQIRERVPRRIQTATPMAVAIGLVQYWQSGPVWGVGMFAGIILIAYVWWPEHGDSTEATDAE